MPENFYIYVLFKKRRSKTKTISYDSLLSLVEQCDSCIIDVEMGFHKFWRRQREPLIQTDILELIYGRVRLRSHY